MSPFNGRQLQQQLRAFLVFIQLHIMMYLLFLVLDGKHVALKKPKNSGALYHNYR